MTIETFDKKSGTKINHHNFNYQIEGEPPVFPLESYTGKKTSDYATLSLIENKLKAQVNKQQLQNKISFFILIIIIAITMISFLITILYSFLFSTQINILPLITFAALCVLVTFAGILFLQKQKKASHQSIEKSQEAIQMLYTNPPEIYEFRVLEKQWYEAVEETTCYYLKFSNFTLRVDLAKYNAVNVGDYVKLAIVKTSNSSLLFIL